MSANLTEDEMKKFRVAKICTELKHKFDTHCTGMRK